MRSIDTSQKLQRAISDWRKETGSIPLVSSHGRSSVDGSYRSDESDNDLKSSRSRDAPSSSAPQSAKRKYRRHPKVCVVRPSEDLF